MNVDFNQQKVTVWGICNKNDVLATVRSKRKEARFWNLEDHNIINDQLIDDHESHDNQSPDQSIPPKHYKSMMISISRPSLSLTRFRSFSWKAMKRVFARSYSF